MTWNFFTIFPDVISCELFTCLALSNIRAIPNANFHNLSSISYGIISLKGGDKLEYNNINISFRK